MTVQSKLTAMHERALKAEDEADRLRAGISELHRVWWTKGPDLDKDAVVAECLRLFRLAALI